MTVRAWIPQTIAFVVALFGGTAVGAGEFRPQGYHPHAAPYPYMYSQGQPIGDWAAPPEAANQDYGNTCCGPHWYDAMVEAVYMTRSGTGMGGQAFTSEGIGDSNVILRSGDFAFDWDPAIRVSGRIQLNAVTNIEATYLDSLNWRERIAINSTNHDLYSVFSQFGEIPFGGYDEIDQATRHEVLYDSDLDTVDVNFRHSWITPTYRASGSWLLGLRYLRLYEQLQFNSTVTAHADPTPTDNDVFRENASFQYDLFTRNEMVGPQIGTELVGCVTPGLLLGGEAKAGVLVNFAEQDTAIISSTRDTDIAEAAQDDDAALVTEANVYLIYQFHPLWKLRGGYQVLYLQGIATGVDNFNTQSPYTVDQTAIASRNVFLDNDGAALIHGATLGLEFGW